MRKIIFSSLTAILCATAMPAMADDTTAATTARGEQATQAPRARNEANSERRICVREATSDTRIRRRVCHTAQEWRDLHGVDEDQR